MPTIKHKMVTVVVTGEGLALLREARFPCSEAVIATAVERDYGIELTGAGYEMESLAGWTAGEANHCDRKRRTRKARIFSELWEVFESGTIRGRMMER